MPPGDICVTASSGHEKTGPPKRPRFPQGNSRATSSESRIKPFLLLILEVDTDAGQVSEAVVVVATVERGVFHTAHQLELVTTDVVVQADVEGVVEITAVAVMQLAEGKGSKSISSDVSGWPMTACQQNLLMAV